MHSNSESIRLRVIDAAGEHLLWVDEAAAQDLIRRGQVHLIRRKGRTRMLQARTDAPAALQLELAGRGTGFHTTRYSHNRETEDNVANVWTLRRLESAEPFECVLAGCLR